MGYKKTGDRRYTPCFYQVRYYRQSLHVTDIVFPIQEQTQGMRSIRRPR